MAISTATKSLLQDAIWASSDTALKATPEELGLDRAVGWPPSYEQRDTGKSPELRLFNGRFYEVDSSLFDAVNHGILPWDAEVTYHPSEGAETWVGHNHHLWHTTSPTGPGTDLGPVEPADDEANPWRLF